VSKVKALIKKQRDGEDVNPLISGLKEIVFKKIQE